MSVDHPLAEHEFLDDDHEMFTLREARRAEMEKIESDPQAYIENMKILAAREKAAQLLTQMRDRGVEADDPEEESEENMLAKPKSPKSPNSAAAAAPAAPNALDEVSDDGDVDVPPMIGGSQIPDFEHVAETEVDVPAGTVINISNVRKLVINIRK